METMGLATARRNEIAPLEFSDAQRLMIRDAYARKATDEEFAVLMEIARVRRLNPLMRQIHFVSRWDKNVGREVWASQVSIDGLRAIAERTGLYAGQDEPEFVETPGGAIQLCKVRVYRKDWPRPAVGIAYWSEYVQMARDRTTGKQSPTSFWQRMGHTMLAKCAESLALRKAFPEDMSGLYSTEEMAQATVLDVDPEPTPDPKPRARVARPEPARERREPVTHGAGGDNPTLGEHNQAVEEQLADEAARGPGAVPHAGPRAPAVVRGVGAGAHPAPPRRDARHAGGHRPRARGPERRRRVVARAPERDAGARARAPQDALVRARAALQRGGGCGLDEARHRAAHRGRRREGREEAPSVGWQRWSRRRCGVGKGWRGRRGSCPGRGEDDARPVRVAPRQQAPSSRRPPEGAGRGLRELPEAPPAVRVRRPPSRGPGRRARRAAPPRVRGARRAAQRRLQPRLREGGVIVAMEGVTDDVPPPLRVRARTESVRRISRRALATDSMGLAEELEQYPPRPTARAECLPGGHNAVRPCPYVSCQWHLAVDVSEDNGNIKLNFPDLEPWELTETCALDVAGRGGTSTTSDGATLEEVARAMNITRARVQQIEAKALEKLPRRVKDLAEVLIDDVAHDTTRPRSQRGARMRIDYASEPQRQPAPARAAHLPGPDGVTAAVETFWCATLGAAVTGALCTRRHLGRERQTENRSAPLYPVCARCSDGVAVAARLGAVAGAPVSGRRLPVIQAAPPPLARVEWFGEAAPANDPPPAAIEETAVPTPTAPAPPASTEAKVIDLQRLVGQLAHERDQLRGEVEGLTTDLRVAQRDASTSSAAAVRYLDERDEARALLAEALTVGLAAVEQARTLERTWEREAVDNGDRLLVVEAERDQLLRDRAREHQEHPAPPPPASAPLDEALLRRIATQAARQAVRATRDDARLRALADSAGGVDALVRLVAGAARLLGGLTS